MCTVALSGGYSVVKLHHERSEFVSYFTVKTGDVTETSHDEPEFTNVPENFTLFNTKINVNCLVCTYSTHRLGYKNQSVNAV